MRALIAVSVLVIAIVALACGPQNSAGCPQGCASNEMCQNGSCVRFDSGQRRDTGVDAGRITDTGPSNDTGAMIDAGLPGDTGAMMDAGLPGDAGGVIE